MPNKTVFVIGAGASKEAGLPTGEELKRQIATLLDIRYENGDKLISGSENIAEAIELHARASEEKQDPTPYISTAWHIRDALPLAISIDNFIDTHRDNKKIAFCGKLAIIQSILVAEQQSLLYFESARNLDFTVLQNSWHTHFFQLLTENCDVSGLKNRLQTIAFIIFNYDRCIEHFIYHALKKYYRLDEPTAADLVRNISIYHPYGSVGELPCMGFNGGVGFGASPQPSQLLNLSLQIKTFTEGTDPASSEILAIKDHIASANKLVFLGFAFHKLNMDLLKPAKDKVAHNYPFEGTFATTLGISGSDRNIIQSQINHLYSHRLENSKLVDLPCKKLFTEFWRSLAFK